MESKIFIVKIEHPDMGIIYKKNKYSWDSSISFEEAQENGQLLGPEYFGVATEKEYLNQVKK